MTVAGLCGSIYFTFCLGGAPRVKFLTDLGATAFDFGLMAMFGSVAVVFQVAAGVLTNHLRRRKPLWMALCIVHRMTFLGIVVAPSLFLDARLRIWWIIGVQLVHDAVMQLGVPMWFSWMADLLPHESVNRMWASRQRFITASNIAVSILMGLFFNHFEQTGQVQLGFTLLAAAGIVIGLIDISMFAWVPEPPHERSEKDSWRETVAQPLKDTEFRHFLIYIAYWYFAIMTAAPFMVLYMEKSLKMSVLMVQIVMTASMAGTVVASRFWGLLCDTYGQRPIIQMIITCKSLIPLAYLLTPPIPSVALPVLAGMNFIDGIMNAGMMVATQGIVIKATPRRNRAMYVAATNFFASGLVGGLAPLLGGTLIRVLDGSEWRVGVYHLTGFHLVFALSFALRFMGRLFATQLREASSAPVGAVVRHLVSTNPFRVVRELYRLNDSRHEAQRVRAARRLGEIRSPLAINELIRSLKDGSRAVRHAAASALGKIGNAAAAEPLARALFDSGSGIRSPAARALGEIGGVHSLKALLANLRKLDSESLGATIDSLARIGDSAAILPLISLFHDAQEPALRRRIVAALTRLSQTESPEDVMTALGLGNVVSPQQGWTARRG